MWVISAEKETFLSVLRDEAFASGVLTDDSQSTVNILFTRPSNDPIKSSGVLYSHPVAFFRIMVIQRAFFKLKCK